MFDLTNKTALVTGAGQGVGLGIAKALAQQGANVAVNDLLAERAEEAAAAVNNAVGQSAAHAAAIPFDVTDLTAVQSGIQTAADQLGAPVSILVNNAGIPADNSFVPTPFADLDPAEWRKFIDLNLYGVLNCTKAALADMIAQRWGRIITISSGAGQMGLQLGVAAYGAGKGGGIGFTRHIAIENARHGITANTLSLGLMGNLYDDPEMLAQRGRGVPVGRLGAAEDVAAACVWLASEEASWVTAQTIGINGGSLQS